MATKRPTIRSAKALQRAQDRAERRNGREEGISLLASTTAAPQGPGQSSTSAPINPTRPGTPGADPYPRPASQGARGYRSIASSGIGPLAGQAPVAPPAALASQRPPDSNVRGVPGTPITSGFISSAPLEYNHELSGRSAIPIYARMKWSSGQNYATLEAVRRPILSAKWDIVAPDAETTRTNRREANAPVSSNGAGKFTAAKIQEIVDTVKNNLFGGLEFRDGRGRMVTQRWTDVIGQATQMFDYGCFAHENVWAVDGNQFQLRRLPARHPQTFYQWDVEADGETLDAIIQYGWRKGAFLNVRLEDFALFTYRQEAADFWGRALQRPMYPHWYVVDNLYRIDAIACERNSLGIPVFKLAPGFSKEDRDAAFAFVTSLSSHEATGMVEPPGDQNSGLRIVGCEGRIRDVMPSIQHHNSMISKSALATFIDLGSEGKGGSRALGESQTKVFLLGLQGAADQIADVITAQTIRPLVELNFGVGAPVPRLIAANVQSRSLEDIVTALESLATAGMVVSDEDLRRFVREELALPNETKALAKAVVALRGMTIADEEDITQAAGIQGKGAGGVEGEEGKGPGAGSQGPGKHGGGKAQSAEKQQGSADRALRSAAFSQEPEQRHQFSAVAKTRVRDTASPYWHQPVASTEGHVDWREVNANVDRGQVALRKALGKAKIRVVQSVAKQYAAQLARGKQPTEVAIAHDQKLDDSITPILTGIYDASRGHVRKEVDRLHIAKRGAVPAIRTLPPAQRASVTPAQAGVHMDSRSPAFAEDRLRGNDRALRFGASPQSPAPSPALIADGIVQKMLSRYGASAASMAADLGGQRPDEDEIASALNDLSDGYLDELAGQGARQSSALGRYDELASVDDEIQANGGSYERSEILDQNTCAACAAGDGQSWDSFDEIDWEPGDDCEGGDNCRGTVIAVFG